ncbi:class I SAM-dependent methyltransferase [Lacimonas salitolerans]|uniref:Class I SAM-dependent methyltransferase n=1 Tax=Lacimonas salitolerans TaxID=1323750 RepID=A0ABW4EGA1_9RHOB
MTATDTTKDNLAPVPPAEGLQYLRFLENMHKHLQPEWYLEVGTAQGASLKLATCKVMAIDPRFQIQPDNMGGRPQTHLFETTSDEFFASGIARQLASTIDLAFLDGMHLFEYLLRDFINTEKLCRPDSVIVLHDLVPPTYIAAERDWDRKRTKQWTGDVWKVGVILKEYRPDLDLRVANCRPTGLGVITSLNPDDTTLEDNYDEIVARFMDMSLDDYGTEKLSTLFNMQRAMSRHFHDYVGVPA